MRLAYGHLCDYAGASAFDKPIMLGVFDTLNVPSGAADIQTRMFFIAFGLTQSAADSTVPYTVILRMLDSDAREIQRFDFPDVRFTQKDRGVPAKANFCMGIVNGLTLANVDDADFVFEVSYVGPHTVGERDHVGDIPLYVRRVHAMPNVSAHG